MKHTPLSHLYSQVSEVPADLAVYYLFDHKPMHGLTVDRAEARSWHQYKEVMRHWRERKDEFHNRKPEREPLWAIWTKGGIIPADITSWEDPRGWTAFEDVYINAKVKLCVECDVERPHTSNDYICMVCRGIEITADDLDTLAVRL